MVYVITIGFVHHFGDLKETHKSGPYKYRHTIGQRASDTKGGKVVRPPGFVTIHVIFVPVFLNLMVSDVLGGPDNCDAQPVTTCTTLHGCTRPVGVVNEITNGAGALVGAIEVGPGESPKLKNIQDQPMESRCNMRITPVS